MAELDTIDVELKDLKIVKSIFARHLPHKQVWAYGSRVKWTATHTSDLDCVVFGATDSEIADAKEAFDESDIPFEVQLLNWKTIPDDFKENIREQYFVLQNKLDWRETTLGEIADSNLSTINKNYPHHIIQYLDTGSITCGKIEGVQEVALTDAPSRAKRLVQNGDIIYSTVRPIQRHYGFIKNPPDNLVVSTGFSVITANTDKAYPLYLYYFLTSDDTTEALDVIAEASTSAYPSLKPSDIEAQKISLPSLPEQKAIASVLSSLDDKIDLLHRQNKTLESIAETLFRQWFIEEAQDDWEEGKLGDFIIPKKGNNITKSQAIDGQYPVIAGGLNPSCYHNQCNTNAPVITISASGANAGFVNLYYIPVWSSDSSFIDSKTTNYIYFFYIFLKYYQGIIYDKQEGSAQPHIYPSHLIDLDILKYPLNLIKNYDFNVTPLFCKIEKNQKQIKTLESLRDTLLPKLISGNIRVKYEAAA